MPSVKYYKNETPPQGDTAWLGALSNGLAQAAHELIPGSVDDIVIEFTVGAFLSGSSQFGSETVSLTLEYYDESQVRIGDNLYSLDVLLDATATTALTAIALPVTTTILGIAATALGVASLPASAVAILTAATIGYTYSKFIDPITEGFLDELAGTVDVDIQLLGSGGLVMGAMYRDGLDGASVKGEIAKLLAEASIKTLIDTDNLGSSLRIDVNTAGSTPSVDGYEIYNASVLGFSHSNNNNQCVIEDWSVAA